MSLTIALGREGLFLQCLGIGFADFLHSLSSPFPIDGFLLDGLTIEPAHSFVRRCDRMLFQNLGYGLERSTPASQRANLVFEWCEIPETRPPRWLVALGQRSQCGSDVGDDDCVVHVVSMAIRWAEELSLA